MLLGIKDIIDILLVAILLFAIYRVLRRSGASNLFWGIMAFVFTWLLVSYVFDLELTGALFDRFISVGAIALIVIFQPEIRNVLEHLGRSQLLGRHKVLTVDEREKLVYEIVGAMEYLKKARIGALMVIERDNSLNEYIEKSKKIYADISAELLISLFFPNNPLHDGGVIIQGDKITSAGAVFPTSENSKIIKRLGTRHRAALGIAEITDCISLMVSEETGRLSMAINGELHYNLTPDEIKVMLLEELSPKKSLVIGEKEEKIDEENN